MLPPAPQMLLSVGPNPKHHFSNLGPHSWRLEKAGCRFSVAGHLPEDTAPTAAVDPRPKRRPALMAPFNAPVPELGGVVLVSNLKPDATAAVEQVVLLLKVLY